MSPGGGERIAKQSLECRPAKPETATDEDGQQRARQANFGKQDRGERRVGRKYAHCRRQKRYFDPAEGEGKPGKHRQHHEQDGDERIK